MQKAAWLVLLLSLTMVASAAFGIGEVRQVQVGGVTYDVMAMDSPPAPSGGITRLALSVSPQSATLLSEVPTSKWTYGCSPTSAGMLFGYYDRHGFANLWADGVAPLQLSNGSDAGATHPLIASALHASDYYVSYLSAGPDPWEGGGSDHIWWNDAPDAIPDCAADYMGTNQWKWDLDGNGAKDSNQDGSTSLYMYGSGTKLPGSTPIPAPSAGTPPTDLCYGLRWFVESRGYTVVDNFTQRISPVTTGGFTLAQYQAEINAGRPVLIQLSGHTMVGVGYDSGSTIYVHDTWDFSVHSMTWGGSYAGMAHVAVTVLQISGAASVAPPTVSAVTPSSAANTAPVAITNLAGTNFRAGATVTLNKAGEADIGATGVVVVSGTKITGAFDITGATTGAWDVTVLNSDETVGSKASAFTVLGPPPTVTSITPNTGLDTGSVSITDLAGSGFEAGATVRLKKTGQTTITATSVVVVSPMKITCALGLTGKATGAWDVEVTNPLSPPGLLVGGFTIQTPAPTVTSITPASGYNTVAVSVQIVGTSFRPGITACLRLAGQTDIPGASLVRSSATSLSCTFDLTGKQFGAWDVVITNPDAQTATLPGGFTIQYRVPTVTSIVPSSGLNTGSVAITSLAGTNFIVGSSVCLRKTGQTDIPGTGVAVVSSTKITCSFDLTGQMAGPWNVVVTLPDGQAATKANGFTVKSPTATVSSITPNQGLNTGSVGITALTGTGFLAGATVKLQKAGQAAIVATNVVVVDANTITCSLDLTGKMGGAWDVVVTNPYAAAAVLPAGFTVLYPTLTVSSITPNTGVNTGSVSISSIAGTNFVAGATVKLSMAGESDIPGTDVTVVSATRIACSFSLIGKAIGAWDVVVANNDGQSATLAGGFAVTNPLPTVMSISPASGLNTGSVSITSLAGTNFRAGATALLRATGVPDINAGNVVVVSATKITCAFDLTGATAGPRNVVVTNSDGTSAAKANAFTVKNPTATVTGITPNQGLNTGSVSITNLAGTGFVSGATVMLRKTGQANIAATNVVVVSSTKITCTLNLTGKLGGAWDVVVTNPYSTEASLAAGFTVLYPALTVTSITPNTGVNNATVSVTDQVGTGFVTGAAVKLTMAGQPDIVAASVVVASSTKITCSLALSGKVAGAWDVVVTNNDGQSAALVGGFTVTNPLPTVTSVTPNAGPNTGPISITSLAGANFRAGATVLLRAPGAPDISGTSVTVVSPTKITCTFGLTGAPAGLRSVIVTNSDGLSATKANAFTVRNPTAGVVSITPNQGWNTGSVNVTNLDGTGFLSGATVALRKAGQANIVATSVVVVSPTKITCTFGLTGKLAGPWDVVVTNPAALPGILAGGFTVYDPAPTITSITPSSGTNNASKSITNLAGTNFRAGATVRLQKAGQTDIVATSVAVAATQITCIFPVTNAAVGAWDVVVTNADGQAATLAGGFMVLYPAPGVTSITPNTGVNNVQVNVTITGAYFRVGATALLRRTGQADIGATNVVVVSSTKITCTFNLTGRTPALWSPVVINTDGQSGIRANLFTITAPPASSGGSF